MGKLGFTLLKKAEDLLGLYYKTAGQVQEIRQSVKIYPPCSEVLYKLDEISNACSIIADTSQAISDLFPSEDWKNAAYIVQDKMFEVYDSLNHDQSIQSSLQLLKASKNWNYFSPSEKYFTDSLIRDLKKEGISVDSENSLMIQRLQSQYLMNIKTGKAKVSINFEEIEGIPNELRPDRKGEVYDKVTIVELNKPQLIASLSHCSNPQLRPKLFEGITNFSSSNKPVLSSLLDYRHNFSKELGYNCFAAYILNYQSFPIDPEVLYKKLKECLSYVRPKLENEYSILLDRKALNEQISRFDPISLHPSDMPFYIQKYLDSQLIERFPNYTSFHSIHKYFTVWNVLQGISQLVKALFRLETKLEMCPVDEAWSNDILKMTFYKNGEELGILYMDLFKKNNKIATSAAKYNIFCSRNSGPVLKNKQKPVVILSTNFAKTDDISSSLYLTLHDLKTQGITFAMLQEFYHEFGHAIHSLLSQSEFQTYSGTRVPLDLGEIPSHIFEHFTTDYNFIKTWATHSSSNHAISEEYFSYIASQVQQFPGFFSQIQLSIAIFDLLIHMNGNLEKAIEIFSQEIACKELCNNWFCSIEHFVDYASCYYSYILDKSLSSVIWETVFQKNALNSQAGEIVQKNLLEKGGSVPPQIQINNIFKPFLILNEKDQGQNIDPFYVMEYWYRNFFNNTQLVSLEHLRSSG